MTRAQAFTLGLLAALIVGLLAVVLVLAFDGADDPVLVAATEAPGTSAPEPTGPDSTAGATTEATPAFDSSPERESTARTR